MKPTLAFLGLLAAILILMVAAAKAEPPAEWTIDDINAHIDETNFIVGNHCSATLIALTTPMLLTNQHCIDQYLTTKEREVVNDEGEVIKKKYEERADVPVSQKRYQGHRVVSTASYTTTIEAYDKDFDLALLKFNADKIPNKIASAIHTGDPVRRGEVVYAVGNPLGLDASLTQGVISSVNRRIEVEGEEHDYIQMDAGITGGNSGGALYDARGQLIGVPAASATGTMIGLAIPSTSIQDFLSDNCYGHIFDHELPAHDDCVEEKEKEAEKDEE